MQHGVQLETKLTSLGQAGAERGGVLRWAVLDPLQHSRGVASRNAPAHVGQGALSLHGTCFSKLHVHQTAATTIRIKVSDV
jgi:hypothetical protein